MDGDHFNRQDYATSRQLVPQLRIDRGTAIGNWTYPLFFAIRLRFNRSITDESTLSYGGADSDSDRREAGCYTIQGSVRKLISCAHCTQEYAYLLTLEAIGADLTLGLLDETGSARRAQAQAEETRLMKSRYALFPVPCPNCGFYQDDMALRLNELASKRPLIAGLVVGGLSFIPLTLNIPNIWLCSITGWKPKCGKRESILQSSF
jgi:hypothetical protein